jgi:hypothetical protein
VLILGAFAAVYGLRGSTYLAIALGVQSIARFLLVGLRSVSAGTILLGFAQLENPEPQPVGGRGRSRALLNLRILCGEDVLRRRGPEIADLRRSCVLIRGDRRRMFRTQGAPKIARDLTELPNFRLGAPQSKTQQSNGFDGCVSRAPRAISQHPTGYIIWRNLQ